PEGCTRRTSRAENAHAPHTRLAIKKMASSASVNPVEKSNKKLWTGQSAPVAHPMTSISPNRISEPGTEKWSFMSQRPAGAPQLEIKPPHSRCTQHPDTVRRTQLTGGP